MDLAVHLGLGLAALMAVVFSLGATFDFCARLDQIAERLTNDPSAAASAPAAKERNSFTNAAGAAVPPPQPVEASRTNSPPTLPAACREPGSSMSG